jgi:hypothetical protein
MKINIFAKAKICQGAKDILKCLSERYNSRNFPKF